MPLPGWPSSAAISRAPLPLPILAALVDKSLVRKEEGDRYDLHEVLRQFATEQWQALPAVVATIQPRHSQFYLHLLAAQTARFKSRK